MRVVARAGRALRAPHALWYLSRASSSGPAGWSLAADARRATRDVGRYAVRRLSRRPASLPLALDRRAPRPSSSGPGSSAERAPRARRSGRRSTSAALEAIRGHRRALERRLRPRRCGLVRRGRGGAPSGRLARADHALVARRLRRGAARARPDRRGRSRCSTRGRRTPTRRRPRLGARADRRATARCCSPRRGASSRAAFDDASKRALSEHGAPRSTDPFQHARTLLALGRTSNAVRGRSAPTHARPSRTRSHAFERLGAAALG